MLRQPCEVGRPSRGRIHGRCNRCPKAEGTGSVSWGSMKHRSRFKVVSSGHHMVYVVVARLRNGDGKGTIELEECAELLPGAPRRGRLLRPRPEGQRGMDRRRCEEIGAVRGRALRRI